MGPGPGSGLGAALLATSVLTAFWAVFAWLTVGPAAGWGVVTGGVVVALVFGLGMVVTGAVAALSPALSLLVAMLTYLLQLLLLVMLLTAIERSGALEASLDRSWVGGSVVVGALVWSAALVRAAVRGTPPPALDGADDEVPPGDGPQPRAEGGTGG